MKKLDYEAVKENYEDSLSQFDLHEELTNPNKFASLHFGQLEEIFSEMISMLYELELLDFSKNLYPQDKKIVQTFKNTLKTYFQQIQIFQIGTADVTRIRERIIASVTAHYQSLYKIDKVLTELRVKNLLNNPKGKEIEIILNQVKSELKETQESRVEIDNIKKNLQKELEEAKKGTAAVGDIKGRLGSVKLGVFFDSQAAVHKKNANGEEEWWRFDGWIGKRRIFFSAIIVGVLFNLGLYITGTLGGNSQIEDLFSPEYGVLAISLLLILYMGMSFSTNNFALEKELEIENKGKANIAGTLELFLSPQQSEASRSIILQEATRTLFSLSQSGNKKEKIKNVNLPITEITQIIKPNN